MNTEDLLMKIQQTEWEADSILKNAYESSKKDIEMAQMIAEKNFFKKIEEAKEISRKEIQEKQEELRQFLYDSIERGEELARLLSQKSPAEKDSATKAAFSYFLNDLL